MPNVIYNEAMRIVFAGGVPPAMGVMLLLPGYNADPDHAAVDDGTPNDPASFELSVGGYARKALTNPIIGKDLTTDYVYLDADDTPFGVLATGQTIGGCLVYKEAASDTARVPLLFYDVADTPTNGSAITMIWPAVSVGALLRGKQGS